MRIMLRFFHMPPQRTENHVKLVEGYILATHAVFYAMFRGTI